MAGIAGPAGARGDAGPQGAIGSTGVQGPMAGGGSWSPYRDYTFNVNSDDILSSDSNKAREIASYMEQNPSFRIAIDGSNERRVNAVRNDLLDAGVPSYKIQTGAYGNPQRRSESRVVALAGTNAVLEANAAKTARS